jgi:hypothetical protein
MGFLREMRGGTGAAAQSGARTGFRNEGRAPKQASRGRAEKEILQETGWRSA